MKSLALAGCVAIFLVSAVRADEPAATGTQAAAQSPAEQIRQNPNDDKALNTYIGNQLRAAMTIMPSNPDAAEKQLRELAGLLDELQPDAQAAKTLVQRGKTAVTAYLGQVELARMTLDDLQKKLEANPDDVRSLANYVSKVMQQIGPLARTEPEKADEQLKAAREFLAGVAERAQQDTTKTQLTNLGTRLDSLTRSIESGKKLAALIGKDAAPLAVEAWANGEPLTESDLKGKVVLLDFWAVWCGPCIVTFPHLREWQEKYADKGLVIVGLTRFYNYSWNDATGRAARSQQPVPKEDELQMLEKFAESHNLHHRFAIQKDSSLSDYYGVTGIPHVVVIDRQQKVRLMRVGSGEANAQAIEAMIKQLLDE